MKDIYSDSGDYLMGIKPVSDSDMASPLQFKEYTVLFIPQGKGTYFADFGSFPFSGPVLLFSTPLQTLSVESPSSLSGTMLRFHSDFYCIEYHRAEVACNGLLFNNIYIEPVLPLTAEESRVFGQLFRQFGEESSQSEPSDIVLRAYLQLVLAKSSCIKLQQEESPMALRQKDEQMERFRELLDKHFLTLHKPQDYADLLAIPPNTFTKRCTKYFKKPPSHLITERLILEAKKQLHLTRKSIKEIAYALNFEDEFYFSRVFKKFTKVSPQAFRDMTGISIVADLHR